MRPLIRHSSILEKLGIIWLRFPDLRFCQLIDNLTYSIQVEGKIPYYLEDGDFINILDEIIKTGKFKVLENLEEEDDGSTS